MTLLIDGAKKDERLPEFDQTIKCPDHPDAPICCLHGLGGGGYGPYTYCDQCGKILSKSEDEQ